MKYFTALSLLLALGVVATSHGFALKEEKKILASSAVGVISDLKESALEKKASIIEGAKETAQNKWSIVSGIKKAKIAALKDAVASAISKLAEFKSTQQLLATNAKSLLTSKSAKLAEVYSAVASKVQGLHQYKLDLKDKATSLVTGVASKIHSKLMKKKALLTNLKKPASQVVMLEPIAQEVEPINVQTFVSHEPAVVGKVFVPEIPIQIYEQPQVPIVYGPPANTYGPEIIPI